MTICGKMVDYKSGHKQFDVASAISVWNSQERVTEHFDLLTVTLHKATEQRAQARCSVTYWRVNLLQNNTYSELAGKWNHLAVLRAQMQRRSRQILSRLIFVCA